MYKLKVLYIDDDQDNLLIFSQVFSQEFDVTICNKPTEAIRLFSQVLPDVVIADLRMPEIDGISLIEELYPQRPEIAYFITSANLELCRPSSFDISYGKIEKPWNLEAIRDTLFKIA